MSVTDELIVFFLLYVTDAAPVHSIDSAVHMYVALAALYIRSYDIHTYLNMKYMTSRYLKLYPLNSTMSFLQHLSCVILNFLFSSGVAVPLILFTSLQSCL